jgi:serine/threonine-protein kinase
MPADVSTLLGDRYELRDRVGIGGFSEVWRAYDRLLTRPVAIKLLDDKYARDPEALARFRAEAHNAGRLSHGNIARVYDFGEPEPPYPAYLVMELVDGPALADVLQDGPINPAWCMDIIAQAAAGLHEAHEQGLVHRDVKPANLLLSADAVKIADFGISHALDSAALTMTGVVIGSPGYVAPERASGTRATPASDLYALGVVAYECLVGAPPFTGTGLEVALAHVNQPFPALPGHVPAEVAAFVTQLTNKDPSLRPPDAAAVAHTAGRLRDELLARDGPVVLGDQEAAQGWLEPGSDISDAGPEPAPWPGPATAQAPRRFRLGTNWKMGLAGAAAAFLLISVVLVSMLPSTATPSAASARHHAGPVHGAGGLGRGAAAVTSAVVHVRALVGHRVGAVTDRLHRLGLATRVIERPIAGLLPGTVVAVYPGGRRPVGSLVTIVAAAGPRGRHDAHRSPASSMGPKCASTGPAARPGPRPGRGKGRCNGHGTGGGAGTAAISGGGNSQSAG